MHKGKTNIDTRTAYMPASVLCGILLPGTGEGASALHTPLMSRFWLHILFLPEEISQCKCKPGYGQPLGQETFWELGASLVMVLPSPCTLPVAAEWRTDPLRAPCHQVSPLISLWFLMLYKIINPSSLCCSLSDNSQSVLPDFSFSFLF